MQSGGFVPVVDVLVLPIHAEERPVGSGIDSMRRGHYFLRIGVGEMQFPLQHTALGLFIGSLLAGVA